MAARYRLPLVLLVTVTATVTLALVLWQQERRHAESQTRADVRAASRAVEERASSAVLALQGLRAGYDDAAVGPTAFSAHADVAFARPEIVSLGWAPRVAADERSRLEASEQIRIGAPTGTLFTYPLLLRWPRPDSADVVDLGASPALATALADARTFAEPRVSAPVRLAGDGRLGVFVFAPVFAPDLPVETPGERRDALRGVVVAALSPETLVHEATDRTDVAVSDGPAVLASGANGTTAAGTARVGGRTWQLEVPRVTPSPVLPVVVAGGGLALAFALFLLLRRTGTAEAGRLARRLRAAEERAQASDEAIELVAAATDAIVLDVDRDGVVRACSGAAAAVLGYAPEELVGTPVYALVHPDDLAGSAGRHRYLHRDGTHVELETFRLTQKDALGFASGSFTVLRAAAASTPVRSVAERIASAVALEPDPVELFTIVAEEAGIELDVAAVSLVRFETAGFGTIVGAWQAEPTPDVVPGATLDLEPGTPAGEVYASGRSAPGAAPIRIGNKPWGVLIGEGADPEKLVALAEIAQSAVAYADASARLSSLGTRDSLTNLPDHRAFHEQLRAEVRRAQRHERALSLVLVNLDGFRRLNEEYGRLAGDRALAEAAQRLAGAVRQGEIVSRVGADHFGWILPETEGLNGWIAAERARRAVSATPIEGVGTITASAGVADLQDVGGPDELLALAEVALAHAKSSGGDATFRHSEELERTGGESADDERGLQRLRALARELDAEDPGTEGHSERVARLAEKLAVVAGWPAESAVRLAQAAAVHDVGKLGIDDDVLRKSGPLDEHDLEQIRNHPDTGAEIAGKALDPEQLSWVRHHHERWDGAGYPDRLSGELIPAGARLLALAEAWDSMTSSRLYGEALSTAEALAECRREIGAQFAPEAVEALERLWTLGALEHADVRAVSLD
jgi:diguanylate cyclase (GGDEF)-like protein/PAS domain S-box-containing protein